MDKSEFDAKLQACLNISLIEFLASIGLLPDRKTQTQYVYKSPFRSGKRGGTERTGSLFVEIETNKFYDHGDSTYNGNIIDFVAFLNNWNARKDIFKIFNEIERITGGSLKLIYSSPQVTAEIKEKQASKIEIVTVKELFSYPLLDYLKSRGISEVLGRRYLKEVHYKVYSRQTKPYFALGFKNDIGGYELRNKHFKGTSNKAISTIILNAVVKSVAVFEGFFNFLSFLEDKPQHNLDAFIILNSAGIWRNGLDQLHTWELERVELYLDNDETGDSKTALFLEALGEIGFDKREVYKNFKDYNELVIKKS